MKDLIEAVDAMIKILKGLSTSSSKKLLSVDGLVNFIESLVWTYASCKSLNNSGNIITQTDNNGNIIYWVQPYQIYYPTYVTNPVGYYTALADQSTESVSGFGFFPSTVSTTSVSEGYNFFPFASISVGGSGSFPSTASISVEGSDFFPSNVSIGVGV